MSSTTQVMQSCLNFSSENTIFSEATNHELWYGHLKPHQAWGYCIHNRVTSLEQLSSVEFSGEWARPKVYENCHKFFLGIWFNLEWMVKYSTIQVFKVIFICSKSAESFWTFFFVEEYKNRWTTFIIDTFWYLTVILSVLCY